MTQEPRRPGLTRTAWVGSSHEPATLSGPALPQAAGLSRLFRGSLSELLHPPPDQIPFLHGLRTIAILLVINHHLDTGFTDLHGPTAWSAMPFTANGWSGVDLFFVLSGFFIGGQLWKELWATGTITIRRFVVRRGLRIWPLYFATFLCVLALHPQYASTKGYGWGDLVFLTNYLKDGVRYRYGILSGGWSLCTEEQFYILTPLLCLFARGRSPRWSLTVLWLLFAVVPLLRTAIWMHSTGRFFAHDSTLFYAAFYSQFHTHCDALILGLILAHQWVSRRKPRASPRHALLILLAGCVLFFGLRHLQHEIFIFSALALLFGALVWAGLLTRVPLFRSRIFFWISRLSFGMYLNHQYMEGFVLRRLLPAIPFLPPLPVASELLGTSLLVILSAALALVTFCLIEQPFLQLRTSLLERGPISSQPTTQS